ncbi:MAG: DUF4157 domain-containing protein [Spirochaetales bacterium]|nr:DUF4157 domain-containing protein [Spirochaetales bacterium]
MLGKELKDIEIHTDTKANEMAEAINARAFTHKNHIVFNKGEYQPGTVEGKKLIAHELVHTVQQSPKIQRKEKDVSKPAAENGWFVTHENGKLFIEFKPPVTDDAIDIKNLANKLVEGQVDGGHVWQIFVKLRNEGMVKGSIAPGSTYTFKDTPIMKGLSPKGKVDVSFLYNLGFVKKPANAVVETPKEAEAGFDFFKAVGDFFSGIGGFIGGLFQFGSSDVGEKLNESKSGNTELDQILKNVIKYDDKVYKNVFTDELAKKYRPIVKMDKDGNKLYYLKNGKKTNSLQCQTFCNRLYDEAIRDLDKYLNLNGYLIKNAAPPISEMIDYYNFFESNENILELDENLGFKRGSNKKNVSMKKIQELANQGYMIIFYNDDPEYSDHIGIVVSDKNKIKTFYAEGEINAAEQYYTNAYKKNALGSDINENELPIVYQAGTFPGYLSFLFAANYYTRANNTWDSGHLHFYLVKK